MKSHQATILAAVLTAGYLTLGQECLSSSQECTTKDNHHKKCQTKVIEGECNSEQSYMFRHCPIECSHDEKLGSIGYFSINSTHFEHADCQDVSPECEELAEGNACGLSPDYMDENCALTCHSCFRPRTKAFEIGVTQEIPLEYLHNPNMILKILSTVQATAIYMAETVMISPELASVRYNCVNNDAHCAALATNGACTMPEDDDKYLESGQENANLYEFMMTECAPACQTCDELRYTEDDMIVHECTPDYETNIFDEDDLDDMFLRIIGELPFEDGTVVPDYTVNIHSRPMKEEDLKKGIEEDALDYQVGPWIITLDNFLTDEECNRLKELGAMEGYERSTIEEEEESDLDESEDAYRTSSNSWCFKDCYTDPIATRVIEKLENVTGVPEAYSEYLQLLKYVPGQYYKEHHDYIDGSEDQNPGPRILTFFLYLNDVEEGGSTRFTDIYGDDSAKSIDVQPKKGRALVWPSVLTEDPHQRDDRTYHEALHVTKGLKYGANAWLHLRKFKSDECDYEEYERIMETRQKVDL